MSSSGFYTHEETTRPAELEDAAVSSTGPSDSDKKVYSG